MHDRVRLSIRVRHFAIRTERELLGHTDVKTTMICTHVLGHRGRGVRSPPNRI